MQLIFQTTTKPLSSKKTRVDRDQKYQRHVHVPHTTDAGEYKIKFSKLNEWRTVLYTLQLRLQRIVQTTIPNNEQWPRNSHVVSTTRIYDLWKIVNGVYVT